MSSRTYDQIWRDTANVLVEQVENELPADAALIPKDNDSKLQHYQSLYVKYVQIFKRLEESYDQIVHPQKRRLLRKLLVGVTGRLLETKFEMANLEFSEFQHLDDVIIDMKLTPQDLELPVPKFIGEEGLKRVEEREKIMATFQSARTLDFGSQKDDREFSLAEAILCIQSNERGRQGCLRAKFIKEIRAQAEREKSHESGDTEMDIEESALQIQKAFRGFRARKYFKDENEEELLFLGMQEKEVNAKNNPLVKQEANAAKRRLIRQQYEQEYLQSLIEIKEKISKNEGPDIKESIQDSFRHWYMEVKKETGKLPDFPEEDDWKHPEFKFGLQKTELTNGEDENGKRSGPPSAGSVKGKGGKKGDAADDEDEAVILKPTQFLLDVKKENNEYLAKWFNNAADIENFSQKHDAEIIKNEKRKEVEAEIKDQIFGILEEELQNLKITLEKDKGKKKKGKKDKKPKGKKGKKEKDLTANRTMESLIEELVQSGILQNYTKAHMNDYMVEHNFMAPAVFEATGKLVIEHSLMDVKRVLTEFCILPLGVDFEREEFPYVKSVLLVGSKGSGKTMLVNAIATELGAPIFNLTPKNTADSPFQGKANVTKMMHMVFKVARAMKPAVVYIDDAEMVFAKKVPKDDTSDPKRIKKDLAKYLKGLSPEDRIIVIGTTSKPWDADKALPTSFEKVIYIPKPNYAARYSICRNILKQKGIGKVPSGVNLSLLVKLLDNYSAAEIIDLMNFVLTQRRVRLMKLKPLTTDDFINTLSTKLEEVHENEALFKDWNEKLPNVKKRQGFLGLNSEGDAPAPAKKK